MGRHLESFCFRAVMNVAASIPVHVFQWAHTIVSLSICLGGGFLGPRVNAREAPSGVLAVSQVP